MHPNNLLVWIIYGITNPDLAFHSQVKNLQTAFITVYTNNQYS